ncbi:peroxiredoxin-like family protein [Pseudomonadota bacterium]
MKTLKEQISAFQEEMLPQIPADAMEVMIGATQALKESGIESNGLQVGATAPGFALPNYDGGERSRADYLAKGSVVLSFYRGSWCPYCNLELGALQAALPEIEALGAQLVAVSPEVPDLSITSVQQHKLAFDVLYDQGNRIAELFGLVMTLPDVLRPIYEKFGIDLPKHNGDSSFTLPLPATYIINPQGRVVYGLVDADYTKRMEPADVLQILKDNA